MNAESVSPGLWEKVEADLNSQGYSLVTGALSEERCNEICGWYTNASLYRKTINMARYRFGEGEYKYFQYPLPQPIQHLRENLYEKLAPLANQWAHALKEEPGFPGLHSDYLKLCRQKGQQRPTPLLLTYETGGHNTLHQDLYGNLYFPFQAVFFLRQVNRDYAGGEFVIVEQRPRAQSRVYSLSPDRGDMVIFSTRQRPVKGSRGYYRVQMKHGVSTVRWGRRMTLGIPFHDAL